MSVRTVRPTAAAATRAHLAAAGRIVVKVGSSSLTTAKVGIDGRSIDRLVQALAARRLAGSEVVLVSSGAIAAGLTPLGLARRPRDLATQQAAASVGQGLLVAQYAASFADHGLTVGQVLLTADDVMRRSHYTNARRTLFRLLGLGVVPVVNENDTVATHEIRFGDNDRLAALVAHLVTRMPWCCSRMWMPSTTAHRPGQVPGGCRWSPAPTTCGACGSAALAVLGSAPAG